MHLLFNGLSIHEQFHNPSELLEAFRRVRTLRDIAHTFGQELYFPRNVSNKMAGPNSSVFHQLRNTVLSKDEMRYLLRWFEKQGPFWEDIQEHNPNEVFVFSDDLISDEALAEAAHCVRIGIESGVISIIPSVWEYSPLLVTDEDSKRIEVRNFWEPLSLRTALQQGEPDLRSWVDLEERARRRFQHLTFLDKCFKDLAGRPFNAAGAKMVMSRLDVLNRLMSLRDGAGKRTPDGHRLYAEQFTGDLAPFSDSSDTEKSRYQELLTFRHPIHRDKNLFCSWHGKVRTNLLRLHFSWPDPANGQLYVAHIGRKLTTR